jgi:translation initiation factor RLI1
VKKCPFEAISIINLPTNLERDTTHRYSANSFKLHRLPVPRPGQVLGLVGTNGIGKSTALKILAGKQKPNLGRFDVRCRPDAVASNFKANMRSTASDVHSFDSGLTRCIKSPPDWTEILAYFRGNELQNYFTKILEDNLKVRTWKGRGGGERCIRLPFSPSRPIDGAKRRKKKESINEATHVWDRFLTPRVISHHPPGDHQAPVR